MAPVMYQALQGRPSNVRKGRAVPQVAKGKHPLCLAAQNAGRGGAFLRTQVWHTNKGGPMVNTTKLEMEECLKQLLIPQMMS